MRLVLMTCLNCEARQQILRHHLLHAAQPRCSQCGGPLELSEAAKQSLAATQSAKRGHAKPKPSKQPRVIECRVPRKDSIKCDFWMHPTTFRLCQTADDPELREMAKQCDAEQFYNKVRELRVWQNAFAASDSDREMGDILAQMEQDFHRQGCVYYKVYPSLAFALCHTEMRVASERFNVPFSSFEVRLPKVAEDNPLEHGIGACIVSHVHHDCVPPEMGVTAKDRCLLLMWFRNLEDFTWGNARDSGFHFAELVLRDNGTVEDAVLDYRQRHKMGHEGLLTDISALLRIVVGTCFFAVDNHECIMPDLPRKVVEKYWSDKAKGEHAKAAHQVQRAIAESVGWTVGREIDLPTTEYRYLHRAASEGGHRELSQGHLRRGHMKMQPCGEQSKDRKLIFVAPTIVRPDLPLRASHGYRLRVR